MASFLLPGWLRSALLGRVLPFTRFTCTLCRYICSPLKNAVSTSTLMSQFIHYNIHGEWTGMQTQKREFKVLSHQLFCWFFFFFSSQPILKSSLGPLKLEEWQQVYLGATILCININQKGRAFFNSQRHTNYWYFSPGPGASKVLEVGSPISPVVSGI